MKIKRLLAPAAGALLLVTGTASVALVGGGAASAAGTPSSAFGIELVAADTPVIEAMPAVESTDGSLVKDSLVGLPDNPVASGGVVNVSAKNGEATASVTDLAVGDGLLAQLPAELTTQLDAACQQIATALDPATGQIDDSVLGPLLTQLDGALDTIASSSADSPIDLGALGALDISKLTDLQLDGLCDVLAGNQAVVSADTVVAECNGDSGTTTITDISALGLPVDVDTDEANKSVEIPGVAKLTINEQIPNADGTFTVNALHVSLFDQIDLTVSSATCGEVTRDVIKDQSPAEAPAPSPVHDHVAVTG